RERSFEVELRIVETAQHRVEHAQVPGDGAPESLRDIDGVERSPWHEQPVQSGGRIGIADEDGCFGEEGHGVEPLLVERLAREVVSRELAENSLGPRL